MFKMKTILKMGLENRIAKNNHAIIDQVLRGVGQIMLQENAITGLLFLMGIFYGSVFMGLAALLATTCGSITAKLLRYDKLNSTIVLID